jgi:hypothetical protein
MISWQPFCLKKDFPLTTPVCASCKKTNRTRSFCRERHKHRQLPWCTVYVILSALDATDPSTVVAAPSQMSNSKTQTSESPSNENKSSTSTSVSTSDITSTSTSEHNSDEHDYGETDDIHAIESSRTCLAQVSCKTNSIHWLQQIEGETGPITTESEVKALNDAIRTPSVHPDVHHTAMPPQPYYPMMSTQQQQHYFQQQQQQFAAWHAQYGQHMMMPPPMMPPPMPLPPMMAQPPPPPPPGAVESPSKKVDGGYAEISGDNSAIVPAPEGAAEDEEKKKTEFEPTSAPTSVSFYIQHELI